MKYINPQIDSDEFMSIYFPTIPKQVSYTCATKVASSSSRLGELAEVVLATQYLGNQSMLDYSERFIFVT